MLFSSISFLYYFLPCVLFLYFLVPHTWKNVVLLFFSLLFYAWGEPYYVLYMLGSIGVGYVASLLIQKFLNEESVTTRCDAAHTGGACEKAEAGCGAAHIDSAREEAKTDRGAAHTGRRANCAGTLTPRRKAQIVLTVSIALHVVVLFYYKVSPSLPIGISFYSFQVISYIIDVYRQDVKAQKNPFDFAMYVSLFPQLIAGPIVRYVDIEKQIKNRKHSFEKAACGIRRFIIGLAKKVLLANTLGELCQIFRGSEDLSILFYWMYAIAFTLHIYFDFSGYSDMAIGLGKIMGFDFLENFNYPYISRSVTEFWRRWHMSLGSWFRDYVYIPLGGNRVKKSRYYLNILLVWALTGLWHGGAWNFVIWGLYFAALLLIEKIWLLPHLEKSRVWRHAYLLLAVIVGFVIFDATSMTEVLRNITSMFGFGQAPLVSAEALYYLKSYAFLFVLAMIGATPFIRNTTEKIVTEKCKLLGYLEPIVLCAFLIASTAYLVDGSFNPFLYFRF